MFSQQLNTFSQSLFGFGEQPLTRTNNYHEHVEGVTSVVLVVEGEKLHVIKDCLLACQPMAMSSKSRLKPVPQDSARTDNYQEHVEGETNVVLVVEGEKLYVIKEVSRSTIVL
ncbi:hypothetical protein EB796_024836 [Bugula neritina]|uniref:Uncharacterized protein n=1 Tax=Bugula neritina TaxID=10212 RepID=A0A7J7ISQ9_BUGNE|nr:hypothetical protein EB796_024836 [Bugula neritina]